MKKFFIIALALCLAAASCGGKGIETGNPTSTITPGTYQLSSSDGNPLYTVMFKEDGSAIVRATDENGEVREEVTGTVDVNESEGTFTLEVIFSDGTKVTIYGHINDEGNILNLQITVNGVSISVNICLKESLSSSESPISSVEICSETYGPEAPTVADSGIDAYWVSSLEGSDDNPGTIDKPFRTMKKALQVTQESTQPEKLYKDIYVVGGSYNEPRLNIYNGFGIFGGYGTLSKDGKRYRDIATNSTSINFDDPEEDYNLFIYRSSNSKKGRITIDGFLITAAGSGIYAVDMPTTIRNNNIAVSGDDHGSAAIVISAANENVDVTSYIKNNNIMATGQWVKGISATGISCLISKKGSGGTITLINNEIKTGDSHDASTGVKISKGADLDVSIFAKGNRIMTGKAGRESNPVTILSHPIGVNGIAEGQFGNAIWDKNILIAGEIDQSIKSNYLDFGARTDGFANYAFGPEVFITNNIITGGKNSDQSSGIILAYGGYAKIYNNTIIGGGEATSETYSQGITMVSKAKADIINNIICTRRESNKSSGVYLNDAEIALLKSNLFCPDINLLLTTITAGDYKTYSDVIYLNNLSYANGNIKGDPAFTNEADHNYHIRSGSPVIDAGEDLSDILTDDIDGQSRPAGAAFDIGADEYY